MRKNLDGYNEKDIDNLTEISMKEIKDRKGDFGEEVKT